MVVGIKLCYRADEYEFAFVEKRDMVGHLFGTISNVVGHHHLREPQLSLHFADEFVDRLRHQGIHHRCGFVVEYRFGLCRQRPRNRDCSLHPGAQFRGHQSGEIFDLD